MQTQLSKEDVLSYMDSLRLPGAKSSLFRGGFQSFRGTQHSNAPNGISFRKLWHSRFYTGYFYVPQKRLETSLSGKRRLVHRLIGRSPS